MRPKAPKSFGGSQLKTLQLAGRLDSQEKAIHLTNLVKTSSLPAGEASKGLLRPLISLQRRVYLGSHACPIVNPMSFHDEFLASPKVDRGRGILDPLSFGSLVANTPIEVNRVHSMRLINDL